MKKLATWSAVVALSLAFSGSALALGNELDNEGAEDGPSILPWTTSDGGTVAQGSRTLGINQRTGAWFFDMSAVVTGGGTNSLTQRVDVDGCSLSLNDVDLLGTWDASGWIVTQGSGETGDFGTMKIDFTPGPSTTDAGLQSPTAAAYVLKVAGGTIPVAATSADLTISGTADPVTQTFPDVQWDDMVFEIDCVVKSAKISGKLATRRPTHVFGGAVGLLESDDIAPGSIITISYKRSVDALGTGKNVSCDFTEDGGTTDITGDVVTLTGWSYLCNDPGPASGTAILVLVDRDTDGPRGSICVDAESDDGLDILTGDSLCDAGGDQVDIDKGNVIVND